MKAILRRIGRILLLKGFVAAPGMISLSGLMLALITRTMDETIPWVMSDIVKGHGFEPGLARTVLGTLAGAAMSALGMVYSITLVVFTLASSIAPRLLERFSQGRINQIAIGTLGALFLHSLLSLMIAPQDSPTLAPVIAAGIMAVLAVLLLLLFVDTVAKRVTIDEEIAAIADEFDNQIAAAAKISSELQREDLVLPHGREAVLRAPVSGYLNTIAVNELLDHAIKFESFIDFTAGPGDHVLEGQVIARAIGGDVEGMVKKAPEAITIQPRRTTEGDLRFSASLLLEIALRALSPGVNDTFTAITCVHRLTGSFAKAARKGLNSGVYCDRDGAARVVLPNTGIEVLIRFTFDPIRTCCRGNMQMADAMLTSLRQLSGHVEGPALKEVERQIYLLLAEAEKGDPLDEDIRALRKIGPPVTGEQMA